MKEEVNKILCKYEILWQDFYFVHQHTLIDYPHLVQHILIKELEDHLIELREEFNSETNLKELFKEKARIRYGKIKNTAISYMANPESPTNLLYHELFDVIYKDQNDFITRLRVLCPEIAYVLQLDCSVQVMKYEGTQRLVPKVDMSVNDLSSLDDTVRSFSEIVVDGNILLPVHTVINKNYRHFLRSIYTNLQHYPNLYDKLKSHNDCIRDLYWLIEFVNHKTMAPYQAIDELCNQLMLGSEKITGHELASVSTIIAIQHFLYYLESLSEPFQKELLSLKGEKGDHLGKIINDLKTNYFQCVELASLRLKKILSRSENKNILTTVPDENAQAHKLIQDINQMSEDIIDARGRELSHVLPPDLLASVIGDIKIENPMQFGEFLSNFDGKHYIQILENISYIPIKTRKDLLKICFFLTSDQKLHLIDIAGSRLKKLFKFVLASDLGDFLFHFEGEIYSSLISNMSSLPLTSFYTLIICLERLPKHSRYDFFEAINRHRSDILKYIKTPAHVGRLLCLFEDVHFENIIKNVKDLPIFNLNHLKICLNHFTMDQKLIVVGALNLGIKNIINTPLEWSEFFSFFDEKAFQGLVEQYSIFLKFTGCNDLYNYLFYLSPPQKMMFLNSFKPHLNTLVDSSEELDKILNLCSVPEKEQEMFISNYFGRTPSALPFFGGLKRGLLGGFLNRDQPMNSGSDRPLTPT